MRKGRSGGGEWQFAWESNQNRIYNLLSTNVMYVQYIHSVYIAIQAQHKNNKCNNNNNK